MKSHKKIWDFGFFISEAAIGIRRSGLMMGLAIAIITISLVVLGFFILMSSNLTHFSDNLVSKLELRVFLRDNLTEADRKTFQTRVSKMESVTEVTFIPKHVAWEDFKKSFKSLDLNDYVDKNPLPHSLRVQISDITQIKTLADYLTTFATEVEKVVYGGTVAKRIAKFSNATKVGGVVLVSLLTLATLLIIMNTIRLTVIARQEEIEVMKLVGATHHFIKWPFLFEGLFIGLTGAVCAIILLKIGYSVIAQKAQAAMPFFPIVYDSMILNGIYITILLVGTGLGMMGAYIAITGSLRKAI